MTAEATRLTISAVSLAAPLADLRHATLAGKVLATFQRSAYLDLGGRIVTLAAADLAPGPFVITVDDFAAVRKQCTVGRVSAGGGRLRIGTVEVDLSKSTIWDPRLPPPPGAEAAAAAREAAIEELITSAPAESVVSLLHPVRARGPLLDPLSRGLTAIARLLDDPEATGDAQRAVAAEIAGRGPGLTPSGDDLLMGIVLALVTWPRLAGPPLAKETKAAGAAEARAAEVRDLLVEAAQPRTTRISGAYLDAARRGWAAEPWHALIRSLHISPAATRAAVQRLVRIGETSGADALTGFSWAWRRLEG